MESKRASTIAKLILESSIVMTSEVMLVSVFLLYLYIIFRYKYDYLKITKNSIRLNIKYFISRKIRERNFYI